MAIPPEAPEAAAATARSAPPPGEWDRLVRWIKLYSWVQVGFLAILVGTSHFFPLIGKQWSSCLVRGTGATDWACVAFYHLYEIPLAVLFTYHACVGLARITRARLPYYTFLTLFQIVMLFVFVTFESKTLLDALAHQAPTWEIAVFFFACGGMIADSILGFYVVFAKLLPAYHGS